MPRYDYKCEAGHKYERQEPFGSPAKQPCIKCGKPALRLLVAPPLVFKAGGFYKTSGRSESGSSSEASSSNGSKKSESAKAKSESGAASETKAKRAEKVKSAD